MPGTPFAAYGSDCLLSGTLDLPDDTRLTDYLNDTDVIRLTSVEATALDDGRVVRTDELELSCDELYAVEVTASVADPARRIATRTARVEVDLAPYHVLGHLHAPRGGDPLLGVARRKRMVPLTEATIAFAVAGEQHMRDLDVLIVNREVAHPVATAAYERGKIDEMGMSEPDSRAKDYTGEIML